jgi:glucose-6-phosphate isomerase
MIDLRRASGLPLRVDDSRPDLAVEIEGGLRPGELVTRSLAELRPALADPGASGPDPAYFMYRGVAGFAAGDPVKGRTYRYRYDVTVLPSARLGDEYLRTLGHYHLPIQGRSISYPEVYEVLSGSATFLLQKVDSVFAQPSEVRVLDFIVLQAEVGTKAMMLPDYGHWTVNATDRPLVVSNWVCADCESYYRSMPLTRGASCHVLARPAGPFYARNQRYAHGPEQLTFARPEDAPALGLLRGRPIFQDLLARPQRWRYLCEPDEAEVELRSAIEVQETIALASGLAGRETSTKGPGT